MLGSPVSPPVSVRFSIGQRRDREKGVNRFTVGAAFMSLVPERVRQQQRYESQGGGSYIAHVCVPGF